MLDSVLPPCLRQKVSDFAKASTDKTSGMQSWRGRRMPDEREKLSSSGRFLRAYQLPSFVR